jgi:hypothetical protein
MHQEENARQTLWTMPGATFGTLIERLLFVMDGERGTDLIASITVCNSNQTRAHFYLIFKLNLNSNFICDESLITKGTTFEIMYAYESSSFAQNRPLKT